MDTIAARRPTVGVARTPSAAVLCGVVVAGLAGAPRQPSVEAGSCEPVARLGEMSDDVGRR